MADRFNKVADTRAIPPGKMGRFKVGEDWVLVANLDGEFFAIADTCSHEDASLFKGSLRGECVRCPLHGSRFSLKTGQPLEEPAEKPVDVYPTRIEDGGIYIGPASAK